MERMVEERLSTSDFVATGDRRPAEKQMPPEGAPQTTSEESSGPLLPQDSVQDLRRQWDEIQSTFVDEPRDAVKHADELVANPTKRLAESFSEQRTRLEGQWDRGDNVSTEDLRLALRKYRTFFQRLVAV